MSKLGGWHECYNSDRRISNELGGKWELFLHETFTEDTGEGFEFPTDYDGSPLSLNGLMIVMENLTNTTYYITLDGEQRGYTQANRYGVNRFIIHNGAMENTINASANKLTYSTYSAFPLVLKDKITNFVLNSTNWHTGTDLKIYVLRGV